MWCNFEQSVVEDETISNSFSSRGIFRITSDEEVRKYPIVNASVQNEKMVVSIDKSLVLLEDEMVSKCSYLSFNAPIDVIVVSNSGNLIICGLSDGEIHGVLIKGILLFNVTIKNEDVHLTGRTFASVQQLGNHYYFSCTNGNVYCVSEIDEKAMEISLNIPVNENETIANDRVIMEDVTIERIYGGRMLRDINATVLVKRISTSFDVDHDQPGFNPLIAGSHNDLFFKTKAIDTLHIKLPDHFEGVKQIYNLDNFIVALTNSGLLLNICPLMHTYITTQTNDNMLIEDMLVMENNQENIELLVLTKPRENGALIRMLEFPSMKCNNELDVSTFSWLVRQPKGSVNLYFLTGKNINESNIPTELEMVLVSETDPSDRFKKLIAKGRFDEAEEFGKQFELCLQPIFEAKAKRSLIELSNVNKKSAKVEKQFQKLMKLLASIESKDFIKNYCIISLPSRHILEQYLNELLKRLHKEYDEEQVLKIEEQLHRLKTLQIIDPYECNADWQKFVSHPNLVKMIMSLFKTDIPTACLIWKRHSYSMTPHLNEENLCKLLTLFPSNTEPFYMLQWLRHFIPTVSNTHPSIMPYITDWSIEKTRALQYSEHWPDIGLEFATKTLEIFDELEYIYTDVRRKHEHNVAKLRDLVNALQELSVLKTSYHLIFTLDNYIKESMDETAFCVLQRVHLDKLESLVNDFLHPIFQEKGKTPLKPIKKYIANLVAYRNTVSNWLQRAVACIELLHNIDDRLQCALMILQNSPVPWPDTVSSLIKLGHSTHPLALKINAEYEMQVIKMMAVKYGWPADSVAKNVQLLMLRIVKVNLPDMIDDIRILIKAAPEISIGAIFNCCYQMVKRGQIDGAFMFFKSLKSEEDSKCANSIVNILADMLESTTKPLENNQVIEEYNNLIEFLKLILNEDDPSAKSRYLAIKNRFVLRNKFKLHLKSGTYLVCLAERLNLFNEGVERIIEQSQMTANVSRYIETEVGQLCTALGMQHVNGIWRVCQRLNCLALSCALAYTVNAFVDCDDDNKEDFVNLAMELIIQQIVTAKSSHSNSSSMQLLKEYDPHAFLLAYELLTSALQHERKRQRDLYEFVQYIRIACLNYEHKAIETHYSSQEKKVNEQICKALDGCETAVGDSTLNFSTALNGSIEVKSEQPKKRYSVTLFEDVDVIQPQTQQRQQAHARFSGNMPIVKFVARSLLLMIIEAAEPMNSLFLQLRSSFPLEVRQDIDGARKDFFSSIEKLIKAKERDAWYIMSHYVLEYQRQNKCKIINSDFVSLYLCRLFKNAMMHKDVNFVELFAMLFADDYAMSLLDRLANDIKSDQQKINLLTLCEMYNMHHDHQDAVELIRAKRLKHYYYMEFCRQDPTIKGKFNPDIDNIEQLLKELRNKQLNVYLLERMGRDFGLDYQKMLITQVMSILSSQQLQYEIKTDAFGREELVMLSTVKAMRDMCQPYITEIKNTDLLTSKLKQFINEINTYFYELYLCVIEILIFFDAVPKEMEIWTNILHFLKHKMVTRRCNRPGQLETDLWLQSQQEVGVLPKIARYRLPFKAIVEQPIKDILDSELNVDNCQSWFPLIQMHTVLKGSKDIAANCDYFCMSAVKNSIAEYKAKNESTETWHLHPTNNAFLKCVLRLVQHVNNPCKAFLILYFVANYAPDGADQVEASYECWKYALEHESLITDAKCQEQLVKIKRKYPILKTQHLLYIYGLTDDKLMRLIENPTELISSLYHHELMLKPSKLDINTVVKEIAKLHDLDLESIQYKLLHKWLAFTIEPADGTVLEDTFFEDQNIPENANEDGGNATENVIRANYILSSWPKEEAMQYLISNIYNPEGACNTSKQLQMFECISKLDDGSTSFNQMISQREFITIKCVHDLKTLGYNSSSEKFADDSCNKINILKTIWQRNGQNPLTVEIMANICLGFDIYIPQIWNCILKRMVALNMIKKLNALVDFLSCKPQLLQTEGLAKAWDYVLQHPFNNADHTRSFAQEEQLHKALLRLQTSPLVHALNLLQFAEQCLRIGRPHMAAVTLSFYKTSEERSMVKQAILKRKEDNLRREILELEDVGVLQIVLNFALKELDL